MKTKDAAVQWAVPEGLELPADPLVLRLDIHYSRIELTDFSGQVTRVRHVSADGVAQALMKGMSISTPLLSEGVLWWESRASGPVVALWAPPAVRVLGVVKAALAKPERYKIPLPGLVFLCAAGRPPAVWAARERPAQDDDVLYHAPLFNVYGDGRSCPGSHKYSGRVYDHPEEFLTSFFSVEAAFEGRSAAYKHDLLARWESLKGETAYPHSDLVAATTVGAVRSPSPKRRVVG